MRTRWLVLGASALVVATACGGSSGSGPDAAVGIDSGSGGPKPQCSDGVDNDGDGKIDYPNDPGCFSPNQDSETDDCPSGPMCPQCANGKDDDGNGKTDYPDDPGCTSAADATEFTAVPNGCGSGTTIAQLTNGSADGMLDGTSTYGLGSVCGQAHASAIAYQLVLTDPKVVVATTAASAATLDTVIDIRSAMCTLASSEIACNDNTDPTTTSVLTSTVTASLAAGTYYVIVEGFDPSVTGAFHVDVALEAGEGAPCTLPTDCGPGLFCNPVTGGGSACSKPMCSDGSDNNGDGTTDYPNDPSCTDPTDNSEVTVCPGVNCPACADGSDNDGDGKTDYPTDPSCTSAAGTSESCDSIDPILTAGSASFSGTIVGAHNDVEPSCVAAPGGLDQLYQLTVPRMLTLDITARDPNFNFFADVALYDGTCGGSDLVCGFEGASTTNLPAGTYFFAVDDDDPSFDTPAAYDVTITGTAAPGESCEGPLFASGAFTCGGGSVCGGTPGSQVCVPPQCSDGIDNNHDGKIDFPNDPGCASPTDNTETTVCPGVNCPVCANGSDDDADGKTDFPADFGCASAGGTSELFCPAESDPASAIATGKTVSTFAAMHNDLLLDCGGAAGHDRSFGLQLPVPVASLTIDTLGSVATDTVLELWSAQCDAKLACNDDGAGLLSTVTVTNLPAGNYGVSVQTYTSGNGLAFSVNTHGTVAAGIACDGALFQGADPVLACGAGLTCNATSHTCQ